jgi:general secretion pathway protein B
MSLILDALRKSEAERRRGEAPGLFTALPTSSATPARKSSRLPWFLLLAIFVVALMAWWVWPTPPAASPVIAEVVAPSPSSRRTPGPIESGPLDPGVRRGDDLAQRAPPPASPVIAEVVAPSPSSRRTPGPIESSPVDPGVHRGDDVSQSLPVPPPPPPSAAPETPAEPPLEALPTLASLAPAERAALPPLKLSMHVWSEAPNARLAIIDGQRVMEGSTVGGSIVAEIRRDGVVLEVHGRRYLLPRP